MRRRHALLAATSALALIAAACGDDSGHDAHAESSGSEPRVVQVEMVDIAFKPTSLQVETGETVRFEFTNDGAVAHDAFIGDAEAQAEHEQEMGSDMTSDMDHGAHGSGDAITVEPGKTGELEHTFDKTGTYEIGCHQPGHYAAGMKVTVTVS